MGPGTKELGEDSEVLSFFSGFWLFCFFLLLFFFFFFFGGGVVSANLETVSCKEAILEFCVLSGSFQIPIKINTPFA